MACILESIKKITKYDFKTTLQNNVNFQAYFPFLFLNTALKDVLSSHKSV